MPRLLPFFILLINMAMPLWSGEKKARAFEIISLGERDEEALIHLAKNLEKIFRAQVLVEQNIPLPPASFDKIRQQYISRPILRLLVDSRQHKDAIVLGVMKEDVYTPGLNFIFGQADYQERTALISLKRLSPSFYGLEHETGLYLIRALKEAVHEIGHVLGLGHCPDPACVMFFSNSILDTDKKSDRFCPLCEKRLR